MKQDFINYVMCVVIFGCLSCSKKNEPVSDPPTVIEQNDQQNDSAPSTPIVNKENGHEWVDLGLTVKWATKNIGATMPELSGDYFAWGEDSSIEIYTDYKWIKTYHVPDKGYYHDFYKYCTADRPYYYVGVVDNITRLEKEDDVAAQRWGGTWRMPTQLEVEELLQKCLWISVSQDGKYGYEIKSENGNSIFLPASGYYDGGSYHYNNSIGYYWTSDLSPKYNLEAIALCASISKTPKVPIDDYRWYCFTVRAVCE